MNVAVAAGVASTLIFTVSTLPMVLKACRTRDLGSYSLAALALATMGNVVHSVYVFNLPMGPLCAPRHAPGDHPVDAGVVHAVWTAAPAGTGMPD